MTADPMSWRLDELSRKVERHDELVTDVAVLKTKMETLTLAMNRNTTVTEHVSDQLEEAQLEPVARQKRIRDAVLVAVISGAFGAGVATLSALIASSH